MMKRPKVEDIFKDKKIILEIQDKLPKLFRIAEIESSRNGKMGMEVGTMREKDILSGIIKKRLDIK